jgi:hypothetical protein
MEVNSRGNPIQVNHDDVFVAIECIGGKMESKV